MRLSVFQVNNVIEDISLARNNMGFEGSNKLWEALKVSATLRDLNIDDNPKIKSAALRKVKLEVLYCNLRNHRTTEVPLQLIPIDLDDTDALRILPILEVLFFLSDYYQLPCLTGSIMYY